LPRLPIVAANALSQSGQKFVIDCPRFARSLFHMLTEEFNNAADLNGQVNIGRVERRDIH
jgi:hypothetical protein